LSLLTSAPTRQKYKKESPLGGAGFLNQPYEKLKSGSSAGAGSGGGRRRVLVLAVLLEILVVVAIAVIGLALEDQVVLTGRLVIIVVAGGIVGGSGEADRSGERDTVKPFGCFHVQFGLGLMLNRSRVCESSWDASVRR